MAKKTVANLNIRIGASSATLTKDFQRATGAVRGFSTSAVSKLTSVVTSLGGLIAASAAAAISIRGLATAFSDIDKTAKLADRIGASTEAIVGLRHAAELSGAGADVLDKSLEQMVRRLGEAVGGTGEAKDALDQMGLSAVNLANRTPEDAFRKIADAINKLPTAAEKAQAAYDLFGRAGQQLLNTLALGSAGLDEAQREAEELGLTFDRLSAKHVEDANDAITRMQSSLTGLAREMAIAVAPAVQVIAHGITDLAKWIRSLDADTIKSTAQFVAFTAAFSGALVLLPKIIGGIKAVIAVVRALAIANTIANATSIAGLATIAAGAVAGAVAVAGVSAAFDKLDDTAAAVQVGNRLDDATASAAESAAAAAQAATQWKKVGDSIRESLKTPEQKLDDQIAKVKEALDAGAISAETYIAKVAMLREAFNATTPAAREAEKWKNIGESIAEGSKGPLDKARDRILQIEEALRRGVISWDVYSKSIGKATGELDAAIRAQVDARAGGFQDLRVGAAVRGTAAGFSAVSDGKNALRKIADDTRKGLEFAKKRTEALRDIAEDIASMEEKVEATKTTTHKII